VRFLVLIVLAACSVPTRSGPSYLGVLYQESREGVEVVQIYPGSPARTAGLAIGDTIVAVDGQRVGRSSSLRAAIMERRPGATIRLTVLRATGERADLDAVVDVLPANLRK